MTPLLDAFVSFFWLFRVFYNAYSRARATNTTAGISTLKCFTFWMLNPSETQLFTSLLWQQDGSERACGRYGSSTCTTQSILPVPLFLQFISKPDLPGKPPAQERDSEWDKGKLWTVSLCTFSMEKWLCPRNRLPWWSHVSPLMHPTDTADQSKSTEPLRLKENTASNMLCWILGPLKIDFQESYPSCCSDIPKYHKVPPHEWFQLAAPCFASYEDFWQASLALPLHFRKSGL